MVKLTALQLSSVPNVAANIQQIDELLSQCSYSETHIVVLPECCLYFGGRDSEQLVLAQQTKADNKFIKQLSLLAQKYRCFLVAGTVPIATKQGDKFTNSCCVFSPSGDLLTQYDKIHLFDVEVNDSEKSYLESKYTQAGTSTRVLDIGDCRLGLSVCYDIRFPELYRQLALDGANVITVPAAFTRVTGKAHWLPLLQARAIENQAYIVASAQEGVHLNGRETWGHSVIISPWGEVLDCLETGIGLVSADFSVAEINRIRASMPVQQHNQFKIKLKSYE